MLQDTSRFLCEKNQACKARKALQMRRISGRVYGNRLRCILTSRKCIPFTEMNWRDKTIWVWVDRLLLAVVGGLLSLLVWPELESVATFTALRLEPWPWWVSLTTIMLVSFLLWFVLRKVGSNTPAWLVSFRSLRNPPLFMFGFVSFCLLYWWRVDGPLLWGIGFIMAPHIIDALLRRWICPALRALWTHIRTKQGHASLIPTPPPNSTDRLLQWMEKEGHINSPSEDRFEFQFVARRIANVLGESKPKTVGLIGRYGSGKTSLLKMVESYLKDLPSTPAGSSQEVITCWISGWGIHEDKAAEVILKEAITKLAEKTDTLSIAYLPQRYRAAISGSGSMPERFLSAVLGDGGTPLACLRRLDRLLCRLDLRMVIFLEDIDRNKDKTCLVEIGTLLDDLKRLDCLTFVLAMGDPSDPDSTLRRVCEYIEVVPRPEPQSLLTIIVEFRRHWLSEVDEEAKCVSDKDRDARLGIKGSSPLQIIAALGYGQKRVVNHLVDLLANPRTQKTSLRRTHLAWRSLKGEIDLDDLLMANAIRMTTPDVFAFINTNISLLQLDSRRTRGDPILRPLQDTWKTMKDKHPEWEAATNLAEHIFRTLKLSSGNSPPSESAVRYQRVEDSSSTDYWARLVREEMPPGEIHDTEILTAIHKWNEDPMLQSFRDMGMREALLSDEEGRVFQKLEQFKESINERTLLLVLEAQIQQTLVEKEAKADQNNCLVLSEWRYLVPDNLRGEDRWASWVERQVSAAIPRSLGYALDLYEIMFEPSKCRSESLRSKILNTFQDKFSGHPQALAGALDPDRPDTLKRLIDPMTPPVDKPFNPEDWRWLGDTLLQAGKHRPEVVIPQIAMIVTYSQPAIITFLDNTTEKLFGPELECFMRLMNVDFDISRYQAETKGRILYCRERAKEWLTQHEKPA